MAVPLQHPTSVRPVMMDPELRMLVLELQTEMRELRAVLFAMAHGVAQTGAGGPDTCLRAVLARVAPMPVEPVVDQAG